jgi:uncharacterized membrane protein
MEQKHTGLSDDVAGVLAYYLVPAIVFLQSDRYKHRPFIRFHSFQAIYLWGHCLVLDAALVGLAAVVDPWLIVLVPFCILYNAAVLLVAAVGMYMASRNKSFVLPLFGRLALKHAGQ